MHRAALLTVVAVLAAGGATTTAQAAPASTGYAYGSRAKATDIVTKLAQAQPGFSGGPTTASTGEVVAVYVQNELLAADPTATQKWADTIAGLVHGTEISTISVYMATLDQVSATCGSGALGCYARNRLISIGQDLRGITAKAVLMHEYGHHVANNRDNSPWDAVDWGTKRWATYTGVCKRAATGELAPGDEDEHYEFNPGEAWAEDFRLLNERRQGLPETFWGVVDESLYPDQTALDLLLQDVTSPWAGNTTSTLRSSVTVRSTGRGFAVATPLDGHFAVTLTAPPKARLTLRLVDPATKQVVAQSTGAERVKHLETDVCGQRTLQVQVKRVKGSGAFTLSVSKA